jgi:hypothetical protein
VELGGRNGRLRRRGHVNTGSRGTAAKWFGGTGINSPG